MARKNQHVVPLGNGWAVKTEGLNKFTVISSRQSDAIAFAKEIAKNQRAHLVIHGKNGRIRDKVSFT